MFYPLYSRFQGAWLGAMFGEALAKNIREQDKFKALNYQPSDRLIRANILGQVVSQTNILGEQQDILDLYLKSDLKREIVSSSEASLVLLPAILFYHDSMALLAIELQQRAEFCQDSIEVIDDVLIWGYAIALTLKGKLNAKNLVDQILVGVGEKQTCLVQQLKHISRLISARKSLGQAVEELGNLGNSDQTAIALSLYCFSYTPEDVSLSIRRAIASRYQTQITASLTGILAGAYNSIAGIPLDWRKTGRQLPFYRQIEQTVESLYQAWSGVYQLNTTNISRLAIASAGTIQSRSVLAIISQKNLNP
jgi:ADP-ribosylglycohydrolase